MLSLDHFSPNQNLFAMTRSERTALLHQQLQQRILILDGAMGTMIQRYKLGEEIPRIIAWRALRRAGEHEAISRATTTCWC